MLNIIIDFEFTGLDNSFIRDNEIVQMKAFNHNTGQQVLVNFATDKPSGSGAFLKHKIKNDELYQKFNKETFENTLIDIGVPKESIYDYRIINFHGFSTSQDLLMLRKYNVQLNIIDIREKLKLSKHEEQLAIEGNSMECAYYIVTNKIPNIENHGDINELKLIVELFEFVRTAELKEYLTVMPHGHCSGMPLDDYVINHRRQADGYRFNNDDILSESLTKCIEDNDEIDFDDDDF